MCPWEANPIISLSPTTPHLHGDALTVLTQLARVRRSADLCAALMARFHGVHQYRKGKNLAFKIPNTAGAVR